MSLDLQDQRFLVTGASRGIGREIAVDLARRGAKVAGLATRTSNLTETQAEVEAAGGSFLALEGDVSKPETAQAAVDAVVAEWGGIDGLVANAGITRDNLLLRLSAEDFDQVIQTSYQHDPLWPGLILVIQSPSISQLSNFGSRNGDPFHMGGVRGHHHTLLPR